MFSYSPEKSKALLAEAGYPNGFDTTWYVNSNTDKDISTAITDMLKNVGINCEMEFNETARISELRAKGWEGMVFMAFTSLASLPSTFRLQVDPYYAYNVSTWRPPDYEKDFIALRQSPTFDQSLAEKAHLWLHDYMVIIPVMQQANSYIVRNSVQGGEFGFWAVGTQWLPSNIWLSR
jgi:ABC-type transport system substrate-binding protein